MPFVYSIGSTVLATFTGVLNAEKQTHRPRNVQRRQECASFVLCILRGIVLTRKLSLEVAPTTSETFSRPWHSRTCFACFSRVIKSRVHVKYSCRLNEESLPVHLCVGCEDFMALLSAGWGNIPGGRLKMRDMILRHQFARVENAGHENTAPYCRGGKCGKS